MALWLAIIIRSYEKSYNGYFWMKGNVVKMSNILKYNRPLLAVARR